MNNNNPLMFYPVNDRFIAVANQKATIQSNKLQIITQQQYEVLQSLRSGSFSQADYDKYASHFAKKEMIGVSQKSNKEPNRSLSIWFHATDRCPLRCTYCHVQKEQNDMSEEVMNQFKTKILQDAKEGKLNSLNIRLAGGEPVVYYKKLIPYLWQFRREMEDLGAKLTVAFLTGLATLPTEVINFIKEFGAGISVSMDGIQHFHDQTRIFPTGRGSFDIIEKNLDKLAENDIHPYIMTVMSNQNMSGFPKFTEYLVERQLGVRYALVKGEDLDRNGVIQTLDECYEVLENAIFSGYKRFHQHQLSDLRWDNQAKNACGAGNGSFSLYLDGTMHFCQVEHDKKEHFGTIYDQANLIDVVDASDDKGFHVKGEHCSTCKFNTVCAGGCPLDRQANCNIYQTFIPKIYRLKAINKMVRNFGAEKTVQLLN